MKSMRIGGTEPTWSTRVEGQVYTSGALSILPNSSGKRLNTGQRPLIGGEPG
jgi:hypothetical protein